MAQAESVKGSPTGQAPKPKTALELISWLGRLLLAIAIPFIAFAVLYAGFIWLRDSNAPRWLIAAVAILWGVGGVAMLYWIFNSIVERLPNQWTARLQPFVFVGPAMAILLWYLALPAVRTFYLSLFGRDGPPRGAGLIESLRSSAFVGLDNYAAIFSERLLTEALRNNLMWIIIGSTMSVVIGLIVAVLADRSKFERVAKSLIFLPMAISFVGASVIWNFVYEVRPAGSAQIGILNALTVALGGQPHPWDKWVQIAPWNNVFLILIVIWLQAGYAMVLYSAALKGIPEEIMEAARVDGATEVQAFFRIMIPSIAGTIITVWTTVVIFTLKIFDVVWVMTGGQFGTHVIATQFYRQSFTFRNSGYGSAIAIILLLTVIPVMIYNLKQFREQEAF
ncbi:MAG: sugar ABC transporter permease [Anaerolineae bacterium]|jgi:alpha-glucoside transport system permease protein|nr:sugar ABC transporter permease [Anaerolineae bacterium]MDX9831749.1 sugar ABC transporter permease [Anaerolineae bacterium]